MKILTAEQIRNWDQFTIEQEPISSIDLMERAATQVKDWVMDHYILSSVYIFCGKGNNGGDGLALARLLAETGARAAISVYILEFGAKGTDDFQVNLARLHQYPAVQIHFVQEGTELPALEGKGLIIDALFGSGLNRGLEGLTARLVEHINRSGLPIISIDIPSGLFADHSAAGMATIKATHTLSLQCYKPAFLFAENADSVGSLHILDIGLSPAYLETIKPEKAFITTGLVQALYKPRSPFSHKGNFGHALLLAGSRGKIGAAVLAVQACLRSGVGLVTVKVPGCGYTVLQSVAPEAMVLTDNNMDHLSGMEDFDPLKYNAMGIGPGIGTEKETGELLKRLLKLYPKPVVLDADALNLIAKDPSVLSKIPEGSILTPHPREFDRLFGSCENEFERAEKASTKSKELNCIIILKGHYSQVCLPGNDQPSVYFNITGNAGMARGGSGDVLTGILTSLLAQGYGPRDAALLGVYIHGLAGDLAAEKYSLEAMTAGDLTRCLGEAFKTFY